MVEMVMSRKELEKKTEKAFIIRRTGKILKHVFVESVHSYVDIYNVLHEGMEYVLVFVNGYCVNMYKKGQSARENAKSRHKYIAFDGIERDGCPNCFEKHGKNVILYAGQKYCSVCGQKIDWDDSDE